MCLQRGRPGFNPWVRKIPWRRAWQSTRVFLPGGSHGQRTLVGYSPWGHDWVTNTFTFTQLLKLLISLLKSLHIRGYGFRVWQKTWVSLLKSVLEKCEVSHQSYIHHMNIWVYECIELCVCVYIYIHTHISIGEGNGTPFQYFCLENPMDGGAWWAAVHGVARVGHHWVTSL